MKNEQFIRDLIDSETICFLASINEDGYPVIRAMLKPIKIDADTFYLHTNTSSAKVQQFINEPKACLYFCNSTKFQGVTLLGKMEVLLEEREKRMFWQEEFNIYYKNGGGITDFTVLKFTMYSGSFYHDFMTEDI
ncbi:pyridoxamine 5'-phosphate oxidase family protein [Enterococcus sp. LJL99]